MTILGVTMVITCKTNAVTLSVLITREHRFSLIHIILFCDKE